MRNRFKDEEYFKICAFAADWFAKQLQEEQLPVLHDFFAARSIDENMIREWSIGFCPPESENDFLAALEAAGFSAGLALRTGLFFHDRKKLRLVSSFSGRMIIPKRNINGRIAGFGARLLEPHTHFIAKYIQSAETPVYSMYDLLFGIDRSAEAIAESGFAILTEGYFDVIRMQQHGIRNCIAPIGTRIGKGQLKQLKQSCRKVLLLFDGDKPGQDGAAIVASLLKKEGMETRVIRLPHGHDADSMLISSSANKLKTMLLQNWETMHGQFLE